MQSFKISCLFVILFALFSFFSCDPSTGNTEKELSYPQLLQSNAAKHLEILSADKFEGRMPCTKGDTLTTTYLLQELGRIGVLPEDQNKATQDVELVSIESEMEDEFVFKSGKGELTLAKGNDIVIHSERSQDEIRLEDAELVFCGYGIRSTAENWDDYEGIDMKNKIAVVLVNDPGFGSDDSTFFQGNTMTIGGRWTRKYDVADEVGAAGVLIIHETTSAGYPWFVVQSSWTGAQQGLAGIDRSDDCPIKGWIHLQKAQELFSFAGMELKTAIQDARKRDFKAKPMGVTLSTTLKNTYSSCTSRNIIGLLPGTTRADEYIIYTTHWDHLGIGREVDGDVIYNGALDNASGTSSLLAMAEAMKNAPVQQERSVIFLFVTAEEQGLLGSEYYAENPIYPLEKTVANINLDGLNPAGKMKDLTIVGMGYSEMDVWAKKYAEKNGRYVMPGQEPEKGFFFRSDQFNFAKNGVPVLYAEGGYDHAEKGKEYAMEFKKTYTSKRYHAPSDEFDETWNFAGMMQDAQLMSDIGWGLANSDAWPQWSEKSEFQRPETLD
ncbi:MAG: M28 family metallopeptidase [Bacteroidota bacterium]